ncbi:unnamed protein product [Paramecium octaurelia]|uniref:WD40-repeat-containing domain n=1 Tax=Paramecium octaurelia TaxID=43137 RepID=A0A8S1YMD3_PAROT|nr:unnamed protein product [Paramecium octaurelia]
MQALYSSQSNIIQYAKSKIEEHFVEIEQRLEVIFIIYYFLTSFLELMNQLTHLLINPLGMNYENESLLELPQFIQFPINVFDFSQQILEGVKPLVNKVKKNEIEIKDRKISEAFCQQKIIDETIQQNNIMIQENDSQTEEIKESQTQKKIIQVENQQKQLEQQLMMYKQVQFNLIDDSNQQNGIYQKYGILNKEDLNYLILIKNIASLLGVQCIAKKQIASFLVVPITKLYVGNKLIKMSGSAEQHAGSVNCLLLNKQENQLISGGYDHKIVVWKVDFIQNDLTFLYSLDQHSNCVFSLSFNQSETVFGSCGFHEFIIWEKGLQGRWEFIYKQNVSYGYTIHFINDQQFLWVTKSKDDILVFELQNGVFKQNSNKTISLIKNNECEDFFLFPIIHKKEM